MKTIENPEAVFDAVVVVWSVLTDRWELAAAGTLEECQRYWDQVRLEGFGVRMQLIRQVRNVHALMREQNQCNHGELVNAEYYDRELTAEEIKELADNPR